MSILDEKVWIVFDIAGEILAEEIKVGDLLKLNDLATHEIFQTKEAAQKWIKDYEESL